MLSVALISQAKRSKCGIDQPSSNIAGDNVLNKVWIQQPMLTNEKGFLYIGNCVKLQYKSASPVQVSHTWS